MSLSGNGSPHRSAGLRHVGLAPTLALALVAISFCRTCVAADSYASEACDREFVRASSEFGVPLGILYAVGLTESGVKGSLHPFALNISGASYYPKNLSEALKLIQAARGAGATLIDVGCMQINMRFHREKFASVEDMFEPAQNVRYGARYLKSLRTQTGSWTEAVARYHAGPANKIAQQLYICAVIRGIAASGFGRQTHAAANYCININQNKHP